MGRLDRSEVQSRGRSICSPIERVEMFAGVMGGKPTVGSPRSAAVWWKIETRWSRFPVVESGQRGAGVGFLEGAPWWEVMSICVGGDARPNSEDEKYRRGYRAQNDVVLRNVGGGKEGSASVLTTVTVLSFFFFFFVISHVHCFYGTRNDMHL